MKKSLFLYLFIIAVLMNIFTYKYFTSKEAAQVKPETAQDNKKMNDSITKLTDQLYDANYFSLEANDRAMNYLNQNVPVYYIDPNPATIYDLPNELKILPFTAVEGMKIIKEELLTLE